MRMARKPRVHFPGALYHVISRGNQRQDIFLDDKDRTAYLAYLSTGKNRYGIQLYAYALMSNHVHLLLEVGETPLSRLMQSLLFGYARYFNKRYGKVGHLFQGRYRAILCEKDAYLLELVRYIHLNPIRAKGASDPERYMWTSHLSYLGKDTEGLVNTEIVLEQFGKNKTHRRRKYLEFILKGLGSGHQKRYYEVKDQRYLGEEDFIKRVEEDKRSREKVIFDLPVEAIAKKVSKITGIGLEQIYSLSSGRRGAKGRGIVAYLAGALGGQMVKDIAEHFGRSPMRISQGIIEIERELRQEKSLREMVGELEKRLTKKAKKKYFITIA
jgi:putative transposase